MMAPKLRSGSNVKSHNPGPHSPLDNRRRPAQPASASKAMRSRNQRQSGKNSRVAGQPDSSGGGQGEPGKPGSAPAQQPESSTFFGIESGYHEPRMRTNAPSFTDTPWSGVSHSSNPILGTMRPLGTLPTDADRIKVGLPPAIPKVKVVRGKKGVVAAEPQTIEPAHPLLNLEEIVASFLALPVPSSLLVDVEKVKSSIEDTLSLAVQCKNVAVARGLLHLWEDSNTDPFVLDVLASVMRDDPTEQEMSAFQSLLRVSWEEVQAQNPDFDFNGANGARRGSESSTSSLSSAKSLDAETFAPGMAPTDSSRPRRGGPGKTTIDYREGAGDDETGPDGTAESRKRLLDDESESEEMLAAKRQRMQKTFPNIVAHESTLRSSLASESPSAGSSPHPEASRRPGATPKTKTVKGKRTTGKRNLSASESEGSENYDYCHLCNGSGQLICCDGCANSFHFSCLEPPLDPANPPAGNWYCPKCSISVFMGRYMEKLNKTGRKDFALPPKLRNHYLDSRSGERGVYEDGVPIPRYKAREARGSKFGQYDEEGIMEPIEKIDGVEKQIFCFACGQASDGQRPTIPCDYCPLSFHLDCFDPPMAKPPYQAGNSDRARQNWMCPNHAYHDMYWFNRDEDGNVKPGRIRRPRHPRLIDVDVLPSEAECERVVNENDQGILYRVPEKGLNESFIAHAKWEKYQNSIIKKHAEEYHQYTTAKYNELLEKVSNRYLNQTPNAPTIQQENASADYNSRSEAERETVANLIALSQFQPAPQEPDRINLLIDQMKAAAPDLPKPQTEIDSLLKLQDLITQRIQALTETPADDPIVVDGDDDGDEVEDDGDDADIE